MGPNDTLSASVNTTIVRRIDLAPHDWAWATWRPRPAQEPVPPPVATPAFKLRPAANRLSRLLVSGTGEWLWGCFTFKPPIAREAAHFWLTAVTAFPESTTPEALARQLEKQTFDGRMTPGAVAARVADSGTWWPDRRRVFWQMLRALLSPGEIMELLLDERVTTFRPGGFVGSPRTEARQWLCEEGGRLTQEDVDRLKPLARARLDLEQWPQPIKVEPPLVFHVAARLGLHEELLTLVRSWPDDRWPQDPHGRGTWWPALHQQPQFIVFGLGDARLVESQMRRLRLDLGEPDHVRAWLAHTELSALDYVRDCILARPGDGTLGAVRNLVAAFCLVKAPEVAPHLLALKVAGKAPALVREWLEQQVGNAIAGLVPVAAGRGKLADAAIEYLREVKRKGHAALIEEQVRQAAPDVADRVRRAVLEHFEKAYPPLSDVAPPDWLRAALDVTADLVKGESLPFWAVPARLPPVVVGEHRLSEEQVHRLLQALKISPLGLPAPLLAAVKDRADRKSLEAFAWRLFELWDEQRRPWREHWVLHTLGHLGGDATALKLVPLIRAWGAGRDWRIAKEAAECLFALGTDTALMGLNSLAERSKPPSLQQRARALLQELARVAGLSRDQLDDRLVPDLGLDERGTRTLDFGPRKFRVVLGDDLKPLVCDENGKVRADLPKPGARDDAEKAAAAVAEWRQMKKQLREAARLHATRLERAMVDGRRWSVREFETLMVRRPLMFNLVRRLLWGGYDDKGTLKTVFRVTEERGYADARDAAVALDGLASVGIVHPLDLEEGERAAWGEVFADYEIVQPFAQLGRPVFRLPPDEAGAQQVARFLGRVVPGVYVVSLLENAGWQRGGMGHGDFSEHTRSFARAGVTAVVQYEPGIVPGGNLANAPEQTLTACYFAADRFSSPRGAVPLGQVDPVAVSEAFAVLAALVAKGH